MISRKSINSSFHYFSSTMVQQGRAWMTNIATFTGNEESLTASFRSSPSASTLHLKDGKIVSMECDCAGPTYCAHLAGLLFYVQDDPDPLYHQEDDDELFTDDEAEPFIRSGKASSYRKVLDPEALIYAPDPNDLMSGDDLLDYNTEIYSDHNDLLNILVTPEDDYYYSKEEPALVQIKWINDKLYIKCHECHHSSNALCKHQLIALIEGDSHWVDYFVQRELDTEDQYNVFTEKNPFTAHLLKKHFYIGYYGENRMYLRSKSDLKMVTAENVDQIEKDLEMKNSDPDEWEEILDTIYERDDKATGNAILWAHNYTSLVIRYLEGRLSKNKKKLTAFIEETDDPEKIPFSLQHDLNKIEGTRVEFDDDLSELQMQHHLEFLHKYATHWNNHLHYLHTDTYNSFANIKKSDLHLFEFADEPLRLNLQINEDEEAIIVNLKLNQVIEENNNKKFHQPFPLFYVIGKKAYVYQNISIFTFTYYEGSEKNYLFSAGQKSIAKNMVSKMINKYGIDPASLDKEWVQTLAGSRRIIRLSQYKNRIQLNPVMKGPESGSVNLYVLNEFSQPSFEEPYYIIIPPPEEKDRFLNWFRNLHPRMDSRTGPLGFYTIHIDDFSENQWFLHFSEECEKAGVILEGWDSLDGFSFNLHRAEIIQTILAERDWFDIHFTIRFGDIIVPQKDWIRAVKKGEKSVLLEDGTYGIIPEEWRLRMTQLLNSAEVKEGKIKLSKLQFNAVDQYVNLDHEPEILKDIEEKKARLVRFKGLKSFDIPEEVHAELRPYQKDGYNWLKFLNEYGFGGCLADDMGLGKTLQVLCLLVDQKENGAAASLVVVPRSLMHNWAAEIEKFCPGLTYILHHGTQRSKNGTDFSSYDVIISTYGTVVNDIDLMKDHTFHYAILDESQAIKNPASRRYRSMIQLSANHKLTMTGTPVENSTLDLFAQLNFINPGLLGNKSQFRKRFADPIDKYGDKEAKELLQKIVHPFLLRRTKNQVAKDLPPKTESILYCEMEGKQRILYHKMKNEIRASLLDDENLEQNKIKVLDGLLKLRQICNSPALLNGNHTSGSAEQPSVKIDTLMEQIEEVVGQEDHSILVFSQFTSMLALVRERLDREQYDYAYLDGSTTKRQAVIDAFNTDPDTRIFLISLKAGNTGLNLTKADFVYLLDPWWNPAVESQAIDRTHRIGQTNPVFAYRFICKDTIEEKIMHLQSKKNKLVEDLIHTDENVFKSLDKEALIDLFE